MNVRDSLRFSDCYLCEKQMHNHSYHIHCKSKKHQKLVKEAQSLANHWIKVTGSPSIHVNEELIRSLFQSHGKILRIVFQNGAFFIRFLKVKSASFSLKNRHINCKSKEANLNINLWVKPVVIQAHLPLEVDVFQVEPENNQLEDFRRILSHTICTLQDRVREVSSTQHVTFDSIATDIVSSVLMLAKNDEGTNQVYSELSRMLKSWKSHLQQNFRLNVEIRVYVFGSVEIGLALSRFSDIDVYLSVGSSYLDMLHETTNLLWQNSDQFHDIRSIKGARVPIVKAVHTATDIPIDISFKSKLGWYNTQLIKFYVKYDTRVKTLLALIKIWFKRMGLNDNRAFTSYSIYWMALFYLQQLSPPLIPSVHQLLQFYPSTTCLRWTVMYSEEVQLCKKVYPPCKNTMCLEELTLGFFRYYESLDLRDSVICPLLGKVLPRRVFEPDNLDQLPPEMDRYYKYAQEFPKDTLKISSQICIQDPYDLSHNICKAVTHASISLLLHHISTVWVLQQQNPALLLLHLLEDRNTERDTRFEKFDAENEDLRLQRLLAACVERRKARDMKAKESKSGDETSETDTMPLKGRRSLVVTNSKRTSCENREVQESMSCSNSPGSSGNEENPRLVQPQCKNSILVQPQCKNSTLVKSKCENSTLVQDQCEKPALVTESAPVFTSSDSISSVNKIFEQASKNSSRHDPNPNSKTQPDSIDSICKKLDGTNLKQNEANKTMPRFLKHLEKMGNRLGSESQGSDGHVGSGTCNVMGSPLYYNTSSPPRSCTASTTISNSEISNPFLQMFSNVANSVPSTNSPVNSPPRPSPPGLQPFSSMFPVNPPFPVNHTLPVNSPGPLASPFPVISPFLGSPSSLMSSSPQSQSSSSSGSVAETLKLLAFHSPQHKLSPGDMQNKDVSNIENQLLGSINVNSTRIENLLQGHTSSRETNVQNRVSNEKPNHQITPGNLSHLDIDSKLQNLKQMIGSQRIQTGITPLKTFGNPGDSSKMKFIDVSTLEKQMRAPQDSATEMSIDAPNPKDRLAREENTSKKPNDRKVKNNCTNEGNIMDKHKITGPPKYSSSTFKNTSYSSKKSGSIPRSGTHTIESPTRSNISISQESIKNKHENSNTSASQENKLKFNHIDTKKGLVNGIPKPHYTVSNSNSPSMKEVSVNMKEMAAPKPLSTYHIRTNTVDKKRCSSILILPHARVDLCAFFDTVNQVLLEYLERVCRIELHSNKYLNKTEFFIRGIHCLDVCQKRNKLLKEAGFDPPRALNHSKFQVEILKSNFLLTNAREAIHQNSFIVSLLSRLVVNNNGNNEVQVNFSNENSKSETNQYVSFLTFVQNAFDVINKEITTRYLSH